MRQLNPPALAAPQLSIFHFNANLLQRSGYGLIRRSPFLAELLLPMARHLESKVDSYLDATQWLIARRIRRWTAMTNFFLSPASNLLDFAQCIVSRFFSLHEWALS